MKIVQTYPSTLPITEAMIPVICTFPKEKLFIKAIGTHSNGPLHTDFCYSGVNICVNGIDDIKNTNQANEKRISPHASI